MFSQWLHVTPNYRIDPSTDATCTHCNQAPFNRLEGSLHSSTHLYISGVRRGLDNETDNVLFNTCMETEKHHKREPLFSGLR